MDNEDYMRGYEDGRADGWSEGYDAGYYDCELNYDKNLAIQNAIAPDLKGEWEGG